MISDKDIHEFFEEREGKQCPYTNDYCANYNPQCERLRCGAIKCDDYMRRNRR